MRASEFRWAQVRVGLFLSITGVILFAAILYFGLNGIPFRRTTDIHAHFDDISGLSVGSPIEMGGVQIGEIARVGLPDLDTGRLPVTLSIEPHALERIGSRSQAFTSSHALVGQRFVGITPRKREDPPIEPGGTLETRSSESTEALVGDARDLISEVRKALGDISATTATLRRAADQLDSGDNVAGWLLRDEQAVRQLRHLVSTVEQTASDVDAGKGALGQLARGKELDEALRSITRGLVEVGRNLEAGEGLAGTLLTDPEAGKQLRAVLSRLEQVAVDLSESQGTIGALIHDKTLWTRIDGLVREMDSLVRDVRRNPQRYVTVKPF